MSSSNGPSAGIIAIIIISVIVGGIVIFVTVILVIRFLQKTKMQADRALAQVSTSKKEETIEIESIEKFLDEVLNEKPIRFTPQNLTDFTRNYAEVLGSGGFGVVYKGQFENGVQVAVKVLRTVGKKAEEQFMAEVATIGRAYHINLVKLYGFCFDKSLKALIYEYMENGSLDKYLFGKAQMEWQKLHDIAIGTAKGIRYLHEECQKEIVHYDIKPANVLLTAEFLPKIADFGLAHLCDRKEPNVEIARRGTPGYAVPELWMYLPNVTHKSDVYSFGMLLFEILGRRRNLELSLPSESQEWFPQWVWYQFDMGELENIMSVCGIEEKDREKAKKMCQVALWCVQYKPEARPSMTSVVRMLEGEEDIVPPVNPFYYMTPDNVKHSVIWSEATDSTSRRTGQSDSEGF